MIRTNVSEYYSRSFEGKEHLQKYNRTTAIEIRSTFIIPDELKNTLNGVTSHYDNIELYTEDQKIIHGLNSIAVREFNINNETETIQMIIFAPAMRFRVLFENCPWIMDTIIISMQSWYAVHGMNSSIRHRIFCKEHCYHTEQHELNKTIIKTPEKKAARVVYYTEHTNNYTGIPKKHNDLLLDCVTEFPALPISSKKL